MINITSYYVNPNNRVLAERVDPRSYKDRGIPLIPIHLGERASALERKGIRTERDNINRAIEKYNAMIMKICGFISELKEELKKGVFRFVFERKNRTEKVGNQSINPSVPKQKPEVQTALEVLAQQEQIQRNSSRVATDLARLSVFKGNLREMEAQQRADEQTREQNRDKKHENAI